MLIIKLKKKNLKFTSSISVATFLVFLSLAATILDITNAEYFHQCRKFYWATLNLEHCTDLKDSIKM